jgi:hypothetical protein
VRGRLRARRAYWATFVRSTMVMSWIAVGYRIPWMDGPPPAVELRNHASAHAAADFVDVAVAALVATGAAEPVSYRPTVVSPLSVIPRRGKNRLVLDLSYLNDFVDTSGTKFTYETISTAAEVVQPGDYMFTIDLESAYHHVDMHADSVNFLGFCWRHQYYVFTSLPFGLNTACWVFTKLMRELVAVWRSAGIRLIHYLDDLLGAVQPDAVAGGTAKFDATIQRMLRDLSAAGLSVSVAKLRTNASRTRAFLGCVLDSAAGTVVISAVRITELLAGLRLLLLRPRNVPARALSRVTGQLGSMIKVLGAVARIFRRDLNADLDRRRSWSSHLALSPASRNEIKFWQQNIHQHNSAPLWPDTKVATVRVWTDAGDNGWGGHSDYAGYAGPHQLAQGYFKLEDRGPVTGSTYRELLALENCLLSLPGLHGSKVRVFVDSLNTTFIWHRGSACPHLNDIAKRLFLLTHRCRIQLGIEWIPRNQNQLADYMSKYFDGDDWQLNPEFFGELDAHWGPHTVDRFSGHLNHLCPRFNSMFCCPGTEAVDAFSQNWAIENNWVNPPFALIGKVILHARRCRATATLICPVWPKRPWWHLVCLEGRFRTYVTAWAELPMRADLFLPGPKHGNQRAVGAPHWRVLALRLDFTSLP